jgi:hypothetical protein
MRGRTDKKYCTGLFLMGIGGASLADHICYGVDAFPLSAVVFGIGFVIVLWSYFNE